MSLARDILDLVWPRTCVSCGMPCEDQVCDACRATVSPRRPSLDCAICGKTILASDAASGTALPVCPGCAARRPEFEAARSAVDFSGAARDVVLDLKYHNARRLAPWMAEWMLGCVAACWPGERFDAVLPVPLHRSRESKRGYNQAALLARALSRRTGIPFSARIVRRVRDTGTQTRLGAAERRANVRGAFEVRRGRENAVRGKCILLVDDVMTTGATLGAAASALRKAGAGRVFGLTFARG